METQATTGERVGWTLAGLAGMVLLYALLLSALAARTVSFLPADGRAWLAAFLSS